MEHGDTWVRGSHFHTYIGHHRVLTLPHEKSLGCAGKDWRINSPVINTKSQLMKQKLMQLWMEINVVTLHKVVETMPQLMRSVIKTKGGPTKYWSNYKTVRDCFFWTGSVYLYAVSEAYFWYRRADADIMPLSLWLSRPAPMHWSVQSYVKSPALIRGNYSGVQKYGHPWFKCLLQWLYNAFYFHVLLFIHY